MEIVMLKGTNWGGVYYSEGIKTTAIPVDVAKRWVSRGIAVETKPEIVVTSPVQSTDDVVKATTTSVIVYEDMKPKALFDLCTERGIELDKEQINGKTPEEKKAYLITMLTKPEEDGKPTE